MASPAHQDDAGTGSGISSESDHSPPQAESMTTVLVALAANLLIAVAKTFAAVVTGAASMLAEAAHSWADTGNEVFLWLAHRKGERPPDASHPMGYGREVYVWSMFAAIGLFAVGAGVSITHGIQELLDPEPASDFVVAYVVLGVSFVLEGVSFVQAWRQSRAGARRFRRPLLLHVLRTSDPTVRAVFFEDAGALIGIVIAAAGVGLHQLTGSTVPDAVGSILVGLLLGVIAVVLISRNRAFLVGEVADPRVRERLLADLLAQPEVASVSMLYVEIVGAGRLLVVGAVDLDGDAAEHEVAERLARMEGRLRADPLVVAAVLSLSGPGEPPLAPTR